MTLTKEPALVTPSPFEAALERMRVATAQMNPEFPGTGEILALVAIAEGLASLVEKLDRLGR
jgi:hypothetical protein